MPVKTFSVGELATSADVNTYLANAGLVYVTETTFSSAAAVTVDNCFTDSMSHYRLLIRITGVSANTGVFLRMRVGGATNANANYLWAGFQSYSGAAILASVNSGGLTTDWKVSDQDVTNYTNTPIAIEVMNPKQTNRTAIFSNGFTPVDPFPYYRHLGGTMSVTTAYDGFALVTNSGGITMSGTVSCYGYRQP